MLSWQEKKNELRSKICQRRLNLLSLMATECDLVRELDFDDVVVEFFSEEIKKDIPQLR